MGQQSFKRLSHLPQVNQCLQTGVIGQPQPNEPTGSPLLYCPLSPLLYLVLPLASCLTSEGHNLPGTQFSHLWPKKGNTHSRYSAWITFPLSGLQPGALKWASSMPAGSQWHQAKKRTENSPQFPLNIDNEGNKERLCLSAASSGRSEAEKAN